MKFFWSRSVEELAGIRLLIFSMNLFCQTMKLVLHLSPLHSGQFLVEKIQREGPKVGLQIAFVWNRNLDKLKDSLPEELILHDLSDFTRR